MYRARISDEFVWANETREIYYSEHFDTTISRHNNSVEKQSIRTINGFDDRDFMFENKMYCECPRYDCCENEQC